MKKYNKNCQWPFSADYNPLAPSVQVVYLKIVDKYLLSVVTSNSKTKAWRLCSVKLILYTHMTIGFQQVGTKGVVAPMTLLNLPATSSRYLYIYTSNATPNVAAFFENFR